MVIRKEKRRPVRHSHINGIDGLGATAKNWLYPYRGGEACYHFNHRNEDLQPVPEAALQVIPLSELDSLLVKICQKLKNKNRKAIITI